VVWTPFTDAELGGKSTAHCRVIDGGANGTRKALQMTGRVTTDFQHGFAGVSLMLDPQGRSWDMTALKGIRFYARGDGGHYQVSVLTAAVKDRNDFSKEFVAAKEWTLIEIPFSQLAQSPYFGEQVRWTGRDIRGVSFSTVDAPRDAYELQVDEISFY
jgi:hypothetical protein